MHSSPSHVLVVFLAFLSSCFLLLESRPSQGARRGSPCVRNSPTDERGTCARGLVCVRYPRSKRWICRSPGEIEEFTEDDENRERDKDLNSVSRGRVSKNRNRPLCSENFYPKLRSSEVEDESEDEQTLAEVTRLMPNIRNELTPARPYPRTSSRRLRMPDTPDFGSGVANLGRWATNQLWGETAKGLTNADELNPFSGLPKFDIPSLFRSGIRFGMRRG